LARILIVDDTTANLDLMAGLLRGADHEVHTATDGASGLAAARELQPDLILCDVQMPGMGGIEVVTQLRGDSRLHTLRVVAVTALTMFGARESLLASGFDGYLEKPVDRRTFVSEVEKYLNPEGHS
jgi:two-component system cell cycle response regulator